jgi:hypothetical protein
VGVYEVQRTDLTPIVVVPPPLPETLVVEDSDILVDFNVVKLPPPLPGREGSALHRRALAMAFGR